MILFLATYLPEAILFKFGQLTIYWYGFILALGFLVALIVASFLFKRNKLNPELLNPLTFFTVFGAIIGARLYYVFYAWVFYKDSFFSIFKIWEGGLAIHGVLIGGMLGLYCFSKRYKQDYVFFLDILAPCVVLGQSVGRWGNYFNQELYGKPTSLWLGIPIQSPMPGYESFTHFHPTFLYESILNLFIFGFLIVMHYFDIPKSKQGLVFLTYVFLYSGVRFFMEFLRIDYSPYVFGMRWAQFFSLSIMLFVVVFSLYIFLRKRRQL